MNIMQSIAGLLEKAPGAITLEDVKGKIPAIQRKISEYESNALRMEREALALREEAFKAGKSAVERASLMRQAGQAMQGAQDRAQQAGVFIQQLGNFRALETTMSIVRELQELNFISKGAQVQDWQKVMDDMASEINSVIDGIQALMDAVSTALPEMKVESDREEAELEALFRKLDSAATPEERADIQRQIDKKVGMAL